MFVSEKTPSTGSGDVAKSRLATIIFQDRMERSPEILEMMKSELIDVMANYLDFDENEIELDLWLPNGKTAGELPSLTASIPIRAWKKRYSEESGL